MRAVKVHVPRASDLRASHLNDAEMKSGALQVMEKNHLNRYVSSRGEVTKTLSAWILKPCIEIHFPA